MRHHLTGNLNKLKFYHFTLEFKKYYYAIGFM